MSGRTWNLSLSRASQAFSYLARSLCSRCVLGVRCTFSGGADAFGEPGSCAAVSLSTAAPYSSSTGRAARNGSARLGAATLFRRFFTAFSRACCCWGGSFSASIMGTTVDIRLNAGEGIIKCLSILGTQKSLTLFFLLDLLLINT